jgi:tRNA pseudouridine65 synthase
MMVRLRHPGSAQDLQQSLRLLHVDADYVAIDKPAGLLVHPSALDAHASSTALGLLRAQLQVPLWTAHRLDKGTSGVLVFARHTGAAQALAAAFAAGQVRKRYLALVRGWPDEEGEIDAPLARDPELPSAGQPRVAAVTRFRRLQCFEWPFADDRYSTSRYALVEVEPLNGRRHQIRRHFKLVAHPLVGDSTHGKGPLNRAVAAWLGVSRLWLHAAELELPALLGRPALTVHATPDSRWQALLHQCDAQTPASSAAVACNEFRNGGWK